MRGRGEVQGTDRRLQSLFAEWTLSGRYEGRSQATLSQNKRRMADEPVSRILCGTQFAKRTACRGDHSSSPGIATGIQQPTRGFSSTMACATAKGVRSFAGTLTHRAGPALPSYLALHHA